MKIDINKIKLTPEKQGFNFCQFGELTTEVSEWASYWNLKTEKSGPYTNILLNGDSNLKLMFNAPKKYQYMDGFSPNLNKHLHVGHLSNLIIANAIQKLGLSYQAIAIFGDTLNGNVDKSDALNAYIKYCSDFGYNVDDFYYASEMKIQHKSLLTDGDNDYTGSKVFDLGDEKIVGIKSNGSTSYFYQDVALAEKLNNTTLYLTGLEQKNHFNSLKKIFPSIDHIGLGLVQLNGKKMSSSEGNIIYLEDFINQLLPLFNDNIELVYNILAGQILKSNPSTEKSINTELISNPKTSLGLYLSYTMAHIKSCGVETKKNLVYNSKELIFAELKSQINLSPNILFEALVKHCKMINKLYETHYIKDNYKNKMMFSGLISDLELGMNKLGMFSIDKV
jgi:arginyl-tRNA synthetase